LISYGPNQLAGYVCNHDGSKPTAEDQTGLFPTQEEVDVLIRDIRRDRHLIACVAMEFSADVEYKGDAATGTAFTKFWIFGPTGALLSTVDLDGRGPKGVPHVCTACHGGDFASETFNPATNHLEFDPNKGPNLHSHFLPFDMSNFAFSSKLSDPERERAIFKMNLDVYNTENTLWHRDPNTGLIAAGGFASASIAQLIQGWYGDVSASNSTPNFDHNFVPGNNWDFSYHDSYQNAVAHSCRTCHVAMENFAFEVNPDLVASLGQNVVCNLHNMPNSKVTFDRFWLSQDPTVPGQPPQPAGGQPYYLSLMFAQQQCNKP
jgi:hypothetical protein